MCPSICGGSVWIVFPCSSSASCLHFPHMYSSLCGEQDSSGGIWWEHREQAPGHYVCSTVGACAREQKGVKEDPLLLRRASRQKKEGETKSVILHKVFSHHRMKQVLLSQSSGFVWSCAHKDVPLKLETGSYNGFTTLHSVIYQLDNSQPNFYSTTCIVAIHFHLLLFFIRPKTCFFGGVWFSMIYPQFALQSYWKKVVWALGNTPMVYHYIPYTGHHD